MYFIRLLSILLISVALPFANVAAATMVHCAQSPTSSAAGTAERADHSSLHADHHAQQDQGEASQHQAGQSQQADSSIPGDAGCSNCSYCQSCASALVAPLGSTVLHIAPSVEKTTVTDLVMQSSVEQPFRPPIPAFA